MKTKILHAALFTPLRNGGWGLPVLFQGTPGIGKSEIIESYAAACGLPCEVLSPGERGEGAFGVVPVPNPATGLLHYPLPDWTARMSVCGLVFCDEITNAPAILQSPLLGLIGAKRIGSGTLGPRVRVVGACNPPEHAANGYDLSPPLANRFGWMNATPPSVQEHIDYECGAVNEESVFQPFDALEEEARVMAAWKNAYRDAVAIKAEFLLAQPHWKNQFPAQNDPTISRAWPSDRSWSQATRALASSWVHKLSDVDLNEFVEGFIGPSAYSAFSTYMTKRDLPNIANFLAGSAEFKHNPERMDRTMSVLNGATTFLLAQGKEANKEHASRLWTFMQTVDQLDALDAPTKRLVKANLSTEAARPVLARLNDLLVAQKQALTIAKS